MNLYKCPKCGYKNYVTKEDIEKTRKSVLSYDFKRDETAFFGQNIKEAWHTLKSLFRRNN